MIFLNSTLNFTFPFGILCGAVGLIILVTGVHLGMKNAECEREALENLAIALCVGGTILAIAGIVMASVGLACFAA